MIHDFLNDVLYIIQIMYIIITVVYLYFLIFFGKMDLDLS